MLSLKIPGREKQFFCAMKWRKNNFACIRQENKIEQKKEKKKFWMIGKHSTQHACQSSLYQIELKMSKNNKMARNKKKLYRLCAHIKKSEIFALNSLRMRKITPHDSE